MLGQIFYSHESSKLALVGTLARIKVTLTLTPTLPLTLL